MHHYCQIISQCDFRDNNTNLKDEAGISQTILNFALFLSVPWFSSMVQLNVHSIFGHLNLNLKTETGSKCHSLLVDLDQPSTGINQKAEKCLSNEIYENKYL